MPTKFLNIFRVSRTYIEVYKNCRKNSIFYYFCLFLCFRYYKPLYIRIGRRKPI